MDFAGRDAWEKKLAANIAKMEAGQQKRLLAVLGDPPRFENVPYTWWAEMDAEWVVVMRPALESIYMEAAEAFLLDSPIGVDWALVNQGAASWARSYTFDLVKGIVENTRTALQEMIGGFYTNQWTLGELRTRLGHLFGPVRAEMIATTEVTRAAVQGELAVVAEIEKANQAIRMIPEWATSNDDLVCPICGPRNGKKQGDGWTDPPPAHVRCRCWVNHVFGKVQG